MLSIGHLIVFLPFVTALISGLFSMSKPNKILQLLTSLCVIVSAICSMILFHDVILNKAIYNFKLFTFLDLQGLRSEMSIRIDSLSAIMMVLVTSVSSCVHIYSMSYMHDDERINRFFSYLSMFTFCMLILVTSDDFVQLFFGWEGVGVSSYLLISFWFKKNSASSAAMKAFITNRVGDFGLVTAIGLCYYIFHTINFTELIQIFPQYLDTKINFLGIEWNAITMIAVFIFIGCMGKSAQFGLHVWLPDAMEGPTPVSALIHAATMVTAGIFLVARCFYFFESSVNAQNLVLVISSITMIFAAICAIFQNDIKKTIAYSTCSQLGYMFVGCAVGRYDAGMFHLVTHGFFKALLFLSAGSIIHATHEQDMTKLPNSLYSRMPFTFILMLIGTLAITGFPPFSGFYSKDAIIEALFENSKHSNLSWFSYIISIITVLLTSFYSWKLIFKIFFTRKSDIDDSHVHESSLVITMPMFLLAIFSIGIGFILMKHFGILEESSIFWNNSIIIKKESLEHHINFIVQHLPLILSLSGLVLSYYFFIIRPDNRISIQRVSYPLYSLFTNKFYIDEIYQFILVRPVLIIASGASFFDKYILDKFGPNGTRDICYYFSGKLQKYHHGLLYKYNFWQFFVMVCLVIYMFLIAYGLPLLLSYNLS